MRLIKISAAFAVAALCLAATGCTGKTEKGSEPERQEALTFDTLSYETTRSDSPQPLDFTLSAEIALPEGRAAESLRTAVISDLLGKQFTGVTPRSLLQAYADTIRSEMTLPETEEFAEDIQLRYEENLKGEVTFAADSFLCYRRTLYIYQGGAHGLQTVQHFSYRLPDGAQLHEEDIFDPAALDRLTLLLREEADKLRNDTILPREQNEFFNNGNIVPNGNFYITDSGITYQYNPYDIAPYSFGATEIHLPADKILPLLNRHSPVFSFFFSQRR